MTRNTARALADLNWDITVLTIAEQTSLAPVDADLLCGIPAQVQIVRSYSPERHAFSSRALGRVVRQVLLRSGLPTPEAVWWPFAVRRGMRSLREQRHDIIYSRAFSPVSHIVALTLKRATGLPWVAHFSDPWVDGPYFAPLGLQRFTCAMLEQEIIRRADMIVFVTLEAGDLVMRKYPPERRAKVRIVPHGYDPHEVSFERSRLDRDTRLHIVHTGSFYGPRTPVPFLQAMSLLNRDGLLHQRLHVTFVGHMPQRYRTAVSDLRLSSAVSLHGTATRRQSLRMVAAGDIALLIDAPNCIPSVYLPSKLVDYLSLSKPILGLTPSPGAAASLLRRLGCTVIAPDDVGATANAVSRLLSVAPPRQLCISDQYESLARQYDIRRVTQALSQALLEVVATG